MYAKFYVSGLECVIYILERKADTMRFHRGINLGGYLSQCNHNMSHYESFISEEDIRQIHMWGFDHVRIPIDYEVFEDGHGNERQEGYRLVARVLDWCKQYGLDAILDLHKAYGYDFNDAGDAEKNNLFHSEALKVRFLGLWSKIANAFSGYDNIAFELLNEVVEAENADLWNALIQRAVLEIRKVTKDTPIIYGGIQWNSARTLKLLDVPEDKNIIFTFHFYEPLLFTHQKASWVKNMDPEKTIQYPESMEYYRRQSEVLGYQGEVVIKAQSETMGREFIKEMIQDAVDAAKKAGVSLYCGEFGVIDSAPVDATLRWFKDVNAVFREYDIGCSIWSYKEMDFGLTGKHYDAIRDDLFQYFLKE